MASNSRAHLDAAVGLGVVARERAADYRLQRLIADGEVDLALRARQGELHATLEARDELREPGPIEREYREFFRPVDLGVRELDDPLRGILVRVHGHSRRSLA